MGPPLLIVQTYAVPTLIWWICRNTVGSSSYVLRLAMSKLIFKSGDSTGYKCFDASKF